jgi:hypothetical protein
MSEPRKPFATMRKLLEVRKDKKKEKRESPAETPD